MPTFTPPGSAVVVPCSNDPCPACDGPDGNPVSCVDCCATFAVTIAHFACAALNGTFTFRRFATLGTTCEWSLDSNGTIRHYLTRLPDGRWSIYRDFLPTTNPCPDDGSYTFETAEPSLCPPADISAWSLVSNTFPVADDPDLDPDPDPAITAIAASDCATGCACFTLFESTFDCTDAGAGWTTPVAIADYCAFADELDWFPYPARDGGLTAVRRRTVKGDACNCDGTGDPCPRQATPAAPTETDPPECQVCPSDYSGFCHRILVWITPNGSGTPIDVHLDLSGSTWTGSAEDPNSGDTVTATLACAGGVYELTVSGLTLPVAGTFHWTAPALPGGGPPLADDGSGWAAVEAGGDYLLSSISCPTSCPDPITVTVTGGCGTPLTVVLTDDGTGNRYSADLNSGLVYNGDGTWTLVVTDPADSSKFAEWDHVYGGDADCPPLNPAFYGTPGAVGSTCGSGWTVSSIS